MKEISIEQIIKTEDKTFRVNDIVKITVKTNTDMNKAIIGRIYFIDGDIITMDVSRQFNAEYKEIKTTHIEDIEAIETEMNELILVNYIKRRGVYERIKN